MPLKLYCMGLLLPGERKSVEPMAARVAPDNVRRMHQSLHHVVADAPWSDEDVLAEVRSYALTAMRQRGPVRAWIVDDTGLVKKGKHSVGVTRQYCGQVGKQENCRVAVSLSVSTNSSSLPIAWRLYLPEVWAEDSVRRKQAGIPEEVVFQTKPAIALAQIRAAVKQDVPQAPVLADAGYGTDTRFREGITELGLQYMVGVMSSVSVWRPGEAPLAKRKWKGTGRPTKLLRRDRDHTSGEGVGVVFTNLSLGNDHLATRYETESSFAVCRGARTASPSRLLAQRAARGRMAAGRVARW
jgi:SRSO17 transposase